MLKGFSISNFILAGQLRGKHYNFNCPYRVDLQNRKAAKGLWLEPENTQYLRSITRVRHLNVLRH